MLYGGSVEHFKKGMFKEIAEQLHGRVIEVDDVQYGLWILLAPFFAMQSVSVMLDIWPVMKGKK